MAILVCLDVVLTDDAGVCLYARRLVCRATYLTRVKQTRQFMEVMNNPEKKAEAEQFLRSRVEPKQD